MADHNFNKNDMQLERDTVTLYAEVTWASGAASLATGGKNKGIASVTDNGTGDITLTLDKNYPSLLNYSVGFLTASAADPNIDRTAAVFTAASTGATLQIITYSETPAAADPTDGSMLITIKLRNYKVA